MAERPITDGWFHRIKAATRDLVKACGGVVRSGEVAHVSKSEISRYQSASDPDVIGLPQALALEAECGLPLITTVMADLSGRRLTDGAIASDGEVFNRHAETVRAASEVISAMAAAQADGHLTAAELEIVDRAYGDMERALAGVRAAIAGRKFGAAAIGSAAKI